VARIKIQTFVLTLQAFNSVVTRSSRPRTALAPLLCPWLTLDTGEFSTTGPVWILLTRRSFAEKVIKAVNGEKGVVEPSFVYLPGVSGGDAIAKATGCDFFSVPIELGVSCSSLPSEHRTNKPQPSGAEKAVDVVSSATDAEKKLLEACYSGLKGNITKGVEFVQNPPQK
jgi:hypothetical protein